MERRITCTTRSMQWMPDFLRPLAERRLTAARQHRAHHQEARRQLAWCVTHLERLQEILSDLCLRLPTQRYRNPHAHRNRDLTVALDEEWEILAAAFPELTPEEHEGPPEPGRQADRSSRNGPWEAPTN
jgi:hypothetical protein